MNNYKLFTAATAVTIAAVSVSSPSNAESVHSFTDVGKNYDEAVSFLYENEIINGISPTKFGIDQPLKRGDAAVILANALGLDTESAPDAGFKDVNKRIKGSVNALAEAGIVSGVTKTEFKPDETLSRGAMAKFLVLGFELQEYETETPFTDVGGVFAPYIEALYGAEITSGKTATSYGTHLDIKRGEFSNLLYNTILFMLEDFYFPVIESAKVTSTTSTEIVLTEAVPPEYSARETAESFFFSVKLKDGSETDFEPTAYTLSADRKTLTIEHKNYDLNGKEGIMVIDDWETVFEAPFNYKQVSTTTSYNVTDETFDYTHLLPATEGTAI
ncbi:S-layer homology domain-containing protein [Bacillus aerolatus]|uniref:S-layer homology domain-containing protein n=1 Tax=Bacillus aerolatus TaxID=2653354 RepID=A0A6I1FGN4_9BACI|nr:S-layer homology domain-containing protein [Bacillus aerolatus]KAB7707416.1 S-layer homology domain-containing protein [Bacillus aerolatus]